MVVTTRPDDARRSEGAHGRADTRAQLSLERAAAAADLATRRAEFQQLVDAAGSTTLDDEHDPEGATVAFERAHFATSIERAEVHLGDVDAALARLAVGKYGRCEVCDEVIGAARLDARPAARTCISCAQDACRPW